MKAPKNKQHYNPVEKPRRYPLELCKDHHICLWSKEGTFKWTVAYFVKGSEGFDLHFVGDRPLDERVNWDHFRELVIQGQKLADEEFEKGEAVPISPKPISGTSMQMITCTWGPILVTWIPPTQVSPPPTQVPPPPTWIQWPGDQDNQNIYGNYPQNT